MLGVWIFSYLIRSNCPEEALIRASVIAVMLTFVAIAFLWCLVVLGRFGLAVFLIVSAASMSGGFFLVCLATSFGQS